MSAEASTSRLATESSRVYSLNGFRDAPVSKLWCCACVCGSLALIPLRQFSWNFILTFQTALRGLQLWKLFTARLFFVDIQGIFAGAMLIYNMRTVERRFGTYRFVNFLLSVGIVSWIFEFAISLVVQQFGYSISYPLVCACFVQYFREVPSMPVARVLGFSLSAYHLLYLLVVQLLTASQPAFVGCVAGALAGLSYAHGVAGMRRWSLVPRRLAAAVGRSAAARVICAAAEDGVGVALPMAATAERQRHEWMERLEERLIRERMRAVHARDSRTNAEHRLPYLQRIFGQADGGRAAAAAPTTPPEADVQLLVDMGFSDRDAVSAALQRADNNVNEAALQLVNSRAASGQAPR